MVRLVICAFATITALGASAQAATPRAVKKIESVHSTDRSVFLTKQGRRLHVSVGDAGWGITTASGGTTHFKLDGKTVKVRSRYHESGSALIDRMSQAIGKAGFKVKTGKITVDIDGDYGQLRFPTR